MVEPRESVSPASAIDRTIAWRAESGAVARVSNAFYYSAGLPIV